MADEQEWLSEEGWSFRNNFWYLYQSSPQNPPVFFQIKMVINVLNIYPIILGWFLIDRDNVNDVAYALAKLSDYLSFLVFVPCWALALFLFATNAVIFGVLIFGYFSPLSMLNGRFSATVRLLFETVAGIMATIVWPVFIRVLHGIKHGYPDIELWQLFLTAGAVILNWWVTTEHAFFNMNSTYFLCQFYGQWNGMNLHTIVVVPSMICFVVLFDNVTIQRIVFCGIQLVEMIIFFRWNMRLQFVVPGFNVSYMIAYTFVWLLSLIWAVNWFVWELNVVSAIIILVLAFAGSVVFSLHAFNRQANKFLKLIEVREGMETGRSTICDQNGRTHRYEFPLESANDWRSVFVLRYLLGVGESRSLEFALFLFEHSEVIDIKMEAIRVLVILDAMTERVREELLSLRKEDVKLSHVQLLFSMKYEAMGQNGICPQGNMDKLMLYMDEVRKSLLKIAYLIECGDFEGGKLALEAYANWCRSFEECASLCFLQSPNSQQLHMVVANYYLHMKGDHVVGHAWRVRGESLAAEPRDDNYIPLSQRDIYSFSENRARVPFHSVGLDEENAVDSTNDSAVSRTNAILNEMRSPVERKLKIAVSVVAVLCALLFLYQIDRIRVQMMIYKDVGAVLWKFPVVIISDSLRVLEFAMSLMVSAYGVENKNAKLQESMSLLKKRGPNSAHELSLMFHNMTNLEKLAGRLQMFGKGKKTLWKSTAVNSRFSPKFDMTLMTLYSEILYQQNVSDTNESMEMWNRAVAQLEILNDNLVSCDNDFLSVFRMIVRSGHFNILNFNTVLALMILASSGSILYFLFVMKHHVVRTFWDTFCATDTHSLETFQENINKCRESESKPDFEDDIVLLDDDELDEEVQPSPSQDLECMPPEENKQVEIHSRELPMVADYLCVFGMFVFFLLIFITPLSYYLIENTGIEIGIREGAIGLSEVSLEAMKCVQDWLLKSQGLPVSVHLNSSLHFENVDSKGLFGRECKLVVPQREESIARRRKFTQFFKDSQMILKDQQNVTKEFDSEILSMIDALFDHCTNSYLRLKKWRFEQQQRLYQMVIHRHNMLVGSGVISVILSLVLAVYRLHRTTVQFESLKSLLKLFCNQHISTLTEFLQSFDPSVTNSRQSEFHSAENRYIVKQSLDAIIILTRDHVIQDVNSSAKALTKYSKGQLIGLDIATIIDKDSNDDGFLVQLDFLMNETVKSSTVSNMFNLSIKQKDGGKLPCSCVLIVLSGEERQDESSPACAIVLRDRTFYTEQEEYLQIAQKRVETLLYRILPRVMATKLLSANNQQLTSKVQRATVIFIGIVNFLDWCHQHSHTEIIELLDLIFSNFDETITEFPTLVKLKVINGTYMAAGGLFNEVSSKGHEREAVEFALKCSAAISRRNALTGSNLQLTVGINTGGPIIAGILGIDKPLFDIWGDAVNVGSRLQTSCPKDFIQISRETYNALPEGLFIVSERDGVFLKGKGVATTYVIDCHANHPALQE